MTYCMPQNKLISHFGIQTRNKKNASFQKKILWSKKEREMYNKVKLSNRNSLCNIM